MISISIHSNSEAAEEFNARMLEARPFIIEIAEMKGESIENTIALVAMKYAETYLKELKKQK